MQFDLSFSPATYFDNLDLATELGATIKGQIRNKSVVAKINEIKEDIEKGGFIPSGMFASELSPSLKTAQGQIHPWLMGGEYLPNLLEGEVEICRIVLKSTTMDVISVRARQGDAKQRIIKYRVVDEYGEINFILKRKTSSSPISMATLIENIDSCTEIDRESGEENDYAGPGLVRPWLCQQYWDGRTGYEDETEDPTEEIRDFVTVHSVFYPDLENYYENQKKIWVSALFEGESEV